MRTVRIEYGQVKKVFILRTFEDGINGKGESESPPKEEVFDEKQEMLKKVYETKFGLRKVDGLSKINSQYLNQLLFPLM